MERLTEKYKRLADEYLVDLNAEQAAIRAGYSKRYARGNAHKLVAKGCIQEYIKKRMQERSKRTEITQDMVLRELANIAFANGADFAKVVGRGAAQAVELTPTDEVPEDKKAAISGIAETKFGIRVATCDKVRALELLGKHLGMFDGRSQRMPDETNLLNVISKACEQEIDTDDIPEIEQAPAAGNDVVEPPQSELL